jgi:pimeloyl-ACP methyl ester carboxylesterase
MALVAHHSGATIAALYSRAHPTRVSRLLLVAPSYPRASYVFLASLEPFDTTAWKSYTHDVAEALEWRRDMVNLEGFCVRLWPTVFRFHDTDASLRGRLSAAMCDAPAATLRDLPRIQHLASKGLFGLNLHDSLATVQSPALVVIGAADSTTLAAADAWTAWLPQARELRVSSPGLFPWLGDHRRFFTAADGFLSGGWPADAFRPSDPSGSPTVAASAVAAPAGTPR